ncbi:hypothetical protein HUW51_08555 [Adhaeribacter swui]|uniref:Uncharacterized protein n=1 Tax=Adhaeribacter swui TaxID=2086471 RepID=A0A7G7G6J5_9BACT|nr:hypothetical protein [Adhaeribacter swui]QNF32779.1 hypothetical protein HUW51_08555 [Adhaeribacter swui]
MKYFFKIFLILNLIWGSSCQNEPVEPDLKATAAPAYFNLSAFISEQAELLQASQVKVKKTITALPDSPETKVLQNINWEQELETFTQADINKPALRAAYDVTTSPTTNGQTKTIYRQRAGYRDTPVEYLEVITSADKQVVAVTGRHRENNYLVKSGKNFSLRCAPVNGKNRIVAYRISGTQKTIFFDPLQYTVQGDIQ